MKCELHIKTALRANRTYLKQAFHTTPLKIADITEDRNQQTLKLMLMSSSPGILDGDEYNIKIEIAEKCALLLQTQSYQRLFNMKKGASQNMEVHLEKNASFSYLPHPVVPHINSSFVAKNKIFLTSGYNLIWADILTCGRKLNGEEFLFSKYHNLTEILLNNRLVIKENLLIRPLFADVNAIGQLEGFTHQASFIYLSETTAINTLTTDLHNLLFAHKNIGFGVSALPINGIIIRLLGYKGEQLHNIHLQMADYLQKQEQKNRQIINVKANAN